MKHINNTRKNNDQRTEGLFMLLSCNNYSKNCFLMIRVIPFGIVSNTVDDCDVTANYTVYK